MKLMPYGSVNMLPLLSDKTVKIKKLFYSFWYPKAKVQLVDFWGSGWCVWRSEKGKK